MHEDKLGYDWHNKVRSLCGIKKAFLTNSMIEAPVYLRYATLLLYNELGVEMLNDPEETPLNQEMYRQAFRHTLASVICKQFGLEDKRMMLEQKGVMYLRTLMQRASTPNSSNVSSSL